MVINFNFWSWYYEVQNLPKPLEPFHAFGVRSTAANLFLPSLCYHAKRGTSASNGMVLNEGKRRKFPLWPPSWDGMWFRFGEPSHPKMYYCAKFIRSKSGWRRSIMIRTLASAGELSLSCIRLPAGWVTTFWLSRPLSVSQHGQLSHPSLSGR